MFLFCFIFNLNLNYEGRRPSIHAHTFFTSFCIHSAFDWRVNSAPLNNDRCNEQKGLPMWEIFFSILSDRQGMVNRQNRVKLGSKLVKRMTLVMYKDSMHINEYLHKCLHHKIHPGIQHCKDAHTKKNIHISAFPHANATNPCTAEVSLSQEQRGGGRKALFTLVKEVGSNYQKWTCTKYIILSICQMLSQRKAKHGRIGKDFW